MSKACSGSPVDVACPCVAGVVGVDECYLVAVTECVSDQWRRCDREEFIEGGVSCPAQVDAEAPEPVHDGVRVMVLSCSGAWEKPWALGV